MSVPSSVLAAVGTAPSEAQSSSSSMDGGSGSGPAEEQSGGDSELSPLATANIACKILVSPALLEDCRQRDVRCCRALNCVTIETFLKRIEEEKGGHIIAPVSGGVCAICRDDVNKLGSEEEDEAEAEEEYKRTTRRDSRRVVKDDIADSSPAVNAYVRYDSSGRASEVTPNGFSYSSGSERNTSGLMSSSPHGASAPPRHMSGIQRGGEELHHRHSSSPPSFHPARAPVGYPWAGMQTQPQHIPAAMPTSPDAAAMGAYFNGYAAAAAGIPPHYIGMYSGMSQYAASSMSGPSANAQPANMASGAGAPMSKPYNPRTPPTTTIVTAAATMSHPYPGYPPPWPGAPSPFGYSPFGGYPPPGYGSMPGMPPAPMASPYGPLYPPYPHPYHLWTTPQPGASHAHPLSFSAATAMQSMASAQGYSAAPHTPSTITASFASFLNPTRPSPIPGPMMYSMPTNTASTVTPTSTAAVAAIAAAAAAAAASTTSPSMLGMLAAASATHGSYSASASSLSHPALRGYSNADQNVSDAMSVDEGIALTTVRSMPPNQRSAPSAYSTQQHQQHQQNTHTSASVPHNPAHNHNSAHNHGHGHGHAHAYSSQERSPLRLVNSGGHGDPRSASPSPPTIESQNGHGSSSGNGGGHTSSSGNGNGNGHGHAHTHPYPHTSHGSHHSASGDEAAPAKRKRRGCDHISSKFNSTVNLKRRVHMLLFWKFYLGAHFPVLDEMLKDNVWRSLEACDFGIKRSNGHPKHRRTGACINPIHYTPLDFGALNTALASALSAMRATGVHSHLDEMLSHVASPTHDAETLFRDMCRFLQTAIIVSSA